MDLHQKFLVKFSVTKKELSFVGQPLFKDCYFLWLSLRLQRFFDKRINAGDNEHNGRDKTKAGKHTQQRCKNQQYPRGVLFLADQRSAYEPANTPQQPRYAGYQQP